MVLHCCGWKNMFWVLSGAATLAVETDMTVLLLAGQSTRRWHLRAFGKVDMKKYFFAKSASVDRKEK